MTEQTEPTEPKFHFRGYQAGDEVAILDTFNKVFRDVCGEGYVDRTPEFWQWEFQQNPYGHRISLAFADSGVVAAQYAGVVYPMATVFGDCTFIHIVDSMTHPDHRKGLKRPGLFVKVAYPWFDLCFAQNDAVMYGYPVPIAERIGKRYLEYHRLRVVDYLCREMGQGCVDLPAGLQVEKVTELAADVDQLFARLAHEKKCWARRDSQFLNWRYVQAPGDDYEIYQARRGGDLVGLMVLRPVHELVPGACTIADWLVAQDDAETMDAFLATATRRGREQGRSTLMTVFPEPSKEAAAVLSRGFQVVSSDQFLERRLTHRIYHPQMTTPWLQEHWWYTLGDSDLV